MAVVSVRLGRFTNPAIFEKNGLSVELKIKFSLNTYVLTYEQFKRLTINAFIKSHSLSNREITFN